MQSGTTQHPASDHCSQLCLTGCPRPAGTNLICAWSVVVISFLPTKVLRRIFPSWIAGLTVFLVGVTLVGVGIKVGGLL